MDINPELKEKIRLEVLKKEALEVAIDNASRRLPTTLRSIEMIHEDKVLKGVICMECET